MKNKIIILIFVLAVLLLFGSIFYSYIYMSDRNLLNRYLISKGYTCIEETCTMKKKNVKYMFDLSEQEFYISNDEYNLNVGREYPILKVKNGNRKCTYQIDNYKRGDLITEEFSYDNRCKEYIEEINKYIKEYINILVEANVKYTPEEVK